MRIDSHLRRLVAAALIFGVTLSAFAQEQKLFAAPASTSAPTNTGAGSMAQATLALVLVLAAVFAAAWGLKRLRKFGGAGAAGIEVISQAALGAKERAVLIKVGGSHVLVGVAPGRVNLLHVLPAGAVVETTPAPAEPVAMSAQPMPTFKSLLRQSLGLK